MSPEINDSHALVIYLEVPLDVRMTRIRPLQENVEFIKSLLLWEKGDRDSGG